MSKPTLYSEAYRIAEFAHKGHDEESINDECYRASKALGIDQNKIYYTAQDIYANEFESR